MKKSKFSESKIISILKEHEKGWHDLLNALPMIDENYKLIFVGDSDHPSTYSKKLKEKATKKGIVQTGYNKENFIKSIAMRHSLYYHPNTKVCQLPCWKPVIQFKFSRE